MGFRIHATFPNEQPFVCLACLLDQRFRNPGDLTGLIQKLFSIYYLQLCPETNEGRERGLINTDVRVRETLQKEVA
jgi:hypothetical protein